jgi:hypothetical protein
LPWVDLTDGSSSTDNFAGLDGETWQVHVYGEAAPGLAATCRELGLPLHAFEWDASMGKAGLTRNALHLVRPDGHVGWVDPGADSAALTRYLAGIRGNVPRSS